MSQLDRDRHEGIFSPLFCRQLHFEEREKKQIEIVQFHLEYREKAALPVAVKTRNPLFMTAFTDEELKNRRLGGFLEDTIFF